MNFNAPRDIEMPDDLIPITDEQAKAIQEASKLGVEVVGLLEGFGGFLKEVFGGVPKNLVGVLGGDWLEYRRLTNLAILKAKFNGHLHRLGIKDTMPPRLTLALPILQAAADESQDELQDLWARLLAAAMDPARSSKVRQSFISTIKQMDPLDAHVLRNVHRGTQPVPPNARPNIAEAVGASSDELDVSFDNLVKLDCLQRYQASIQLATSPYGREFLRIVDA